MNIPDCYDPVYQAERLAMEQDKLMEQTCQCHLCRRTLYPGDKMHTASYFIVCPSCVEELQENIEIVE
ncbi:MAG: hypothetical protein IKT52_13615 [Oscillospiraceae bacterium]|nr:hypothetical protein [Oscillospiraceae bacterium]